MCISEVMGEGLVEQSSFNQVGVSGEKEPDRHGVQPVRGVNWSGI